MQNYCKTIGAMAAASALVAGTASAEVEYEISTGYTNQYIFRGADMGLDLTELSLNAATTYNDINFSAGVWAGVFDDRAGVDDDLDTEVDFYGEVSKDFGFANLGVGYVYYMLVGNTNRGTGLAGTDDQEIYFTASRDFGFAQVALTNYWDLAENNGGNNGYTELTVSRSWEINQCVSVGVGSTLGFTAEPGHIEPLHWTNKVTLDWGFVENAKLSPFVALSLALGDETGTMWGQTDNEFVAGTMLAVSF